jgi:hypothetical protein
MMIQTVKKMILISMILVLAGVACEDDDFLSSTQVVDIFELKYGEVVKRSYNRQTFRFSIEDIEDNTENCMLAYIPQDSYDKVRVHAYLRVETGNDIYKIKVSGRPCGPYRYREDALTTVQYIKDQFESWVNTKAYNENPSWFDNEFKRHFDEGTQLNASHSIYMGAAYTHVQHHQEDNKELYKFIFIIRKN